MIANSLGAQLLNSNKHANTVTNFFDSHLFQDVLVTLD